MDGTPRTSQLRMTSQDFKNRVGEKIQTLQIDKYLGHGTRRHIHSKMYRRLFLKLTLITYLSVFQLQLSQ